MTSIQKLMLNAWASEYALRITPVVNDEHYVRNSFHWTFPQAYYSVLFSVRAALTAYGIESYHHYKESDIAVLVESLMAAGVYPEKWRMEGQNFFEFLSPLRISSRQTMEDLGDNDPLAMLHLLTQIVERVNTHTEAYLRQRMGTEAFVTLIQQQPQYLQESFLATRAAQLLLPAIA